MRFTVIRRVVFLGTFKYFIGDFYFNIPFLVVHFSMDTNKFRERKFLSLMRKFCMVHVEGT